MTANQELENAYKQIRTYEYEINKLRSISGSGSYVEQVKKIERVLGEKEEMSGKLKKQLGELKK